MYFINQIDIICLIQITYPYSINSNLKKYYDSNSLLLSKIILKYLNVICIESKYSIISFSLFKNYLIPRKFIKKFSDVFYS